MFGKIASFEFRYQLRQPAFWVIFIVFALLSFGAVASPNVSLGSGGNVFKNAPYSLALAHIAFNIFFMLGSTAIVANAVARDTSTGYGPLILSTPVSKSSYLFGRFFGAFAAVAICYLSISFGTLLGTVMPWVDPETIGPFRPFDYVYAYGVYGLTGLFMTSALFFMLATVTRSLMATYVGVVGVIIVYLVTTGSLGSKPEFETALAWAEPFGSGAYGLATKYWTAAERNTINAPLEGVLLWNRVIWTLVGAAILASTYSLFQPSPRGAKAKKADRLRALTEAAPEPAATAAIGQLPQASHGLKAAWAQLVSRTAFEMALIFRSPAYLVLMLLGFAFAFAMLFFTGEMYGAPILLVTRVAIEALFGAFALISIVISIYYSGELVWRDRERKMHEIIDASAAPDWTFLIPKTLALVLVLLSTALIGILAGVVTQAIKGYFDFELGKYIVWYAIPQAIGFSLIAILAIFVQALSPNKFVGWAVMVVYMISTIVMSNLGLDHPLYQYGRGIAVPLSDMNGRGDFALFNSWFDLYWTAFAVILLVVVYGLWRRGTETRLAPRLKRFPRRLAGPAGVIGALALVAFVGLGGFIYTNTNVWNEYTTRDAQEQRMADAEKALLRYETTPQPSVADVKLVLDLHPHEPRLTTHATWVLENRTQGLVSEIHLRWPEDLEVRALNIEGATKARDWPEFNYTIYRFATPLQPGDRRTMTFETVMAQHGFKAGGNTTRIVDNGTFVSQNEFGPTIGMNRNGLLDDRAKRRKFGLPAELRPAKLEDESARGHNYIGADWVNADITVTTDADQTPIAPGYKVSDVTRDGRRTARFVTEAPILHFFSVQSARYEILRREHNGVALEVYHDAQHARNAPRMIEAMQASLDYYTRAFSPYQFRQARIVEFPAYASYAQAFANTMPYSEGLGFIADFSDPTKIDYVTYVTAHEMGHQWWAHQVVGSNQQGMTVLSETLAQYSALMVMEKMYGRDDIRRFLKYELDRYLRARGTERLEELPLFRNENQQYIHYQKGGLVMYLLRDQLGEDAVNRALQRVLRQYAFKGAPYPRSLDLVAALRAEAPADKQALITDLMEKITLYDVKTTGVTATRRADGRWDVAVTVDARKLYADGKGAETAAPLNESFDVGLFAAEPGSRRLNPNDVILLERRPIRTGVQTLRFITTREPKFAGVDPYNKWIDRNSDDNIRAVG